MALYYPGTKVYANLTVNSSQVSETSDHFIHQVDASSLMLNAAFKAQITTRANILVYDTSTDSIAPSKILVDTTENTLFIYFDGPKSTTEDRVFSICASSSFTQTDSTSTFTNSGVVNFWGLNETSGTTATDYVAGVVGNNTSITVGEEGLFNKSFKFNNGYINLGDLSSIKGIQKFSASFVAKVSDISKRFLFFRKHFSSIDFLDLELHTVDGNPDFSVIKNTSASLYFYQSNYINSNEWFIIDFVFDGSLSGVTNALKIYVNGVLTTRFAVSNLVPSSLSTSSCDSYIGLDLIPTDGYMDEIAFYNVALTENYTKDRHKALFSSATFYTLGSAAETDGSESNSSSSSLSNSASSSQSASVSSSPSTSLSASLSNSPSTSLSASPSNGPNSYYCPGTKVYALLTVNHNYVNEDSSGFLHQVDASALMLDADFKAQITTRANILVYDTVTEVVIPSKILLDTIADTLLIYFNGPKSTTEDRVFSICVSPLFNQADSTLAFTSSGITNFWGMDESSGSTIADYAGSLPLTNTNNILGTAGIFSNKLTGAADGYTKTSSGNTNGATKFSLSMVAYINSFNGVQVFFQVRSDAALALNFSTNSAVPYAALRCGADSQIEIPLTNFTIGAYNYLTYVYDGTKSANDRLLFYINGVKVTNYTVTTPALTAIPTISGVYYSFSGRPGSPTYPIDGSIDNIVVKVGSTETEGEIKDRYSSLSSPGTFYTIGSAELILSNPYKFVALTASTTYSKAAYSEDNINWAVVDVPSPPFQRWAKMASNNGVLVAVASDKALNSQKAIVSRDGINWKWATSPNTDIYWQSVCYGNGIFVAVGSYDTSATKNRVMASTDGLTWTSYSVPLQIAWKSVCYGNGIFVAVANSGSPARVMTSTNGMTWVGRNSPTNNWRCVCYGNGIFVAVGDSGTNNRVMTSTNGFTWTNRTTNSNNWYSVCYAQGMFVAVSITGTGDRVMTSTNGLTWTLRSSAGDYSWSNVIYGNAQFVALSWEGKVMTSPNGIDWTLLDGPEEYTWDSINYFEEIPLFTLHPQSQLINKGEQVTFTVETVGDVTLAWFKDNVEVEGETGSTYSFIVSESDNESEIYCEATNAYGTDRSDVAVLNVFSSLSNSESISLSSSLSNSPSTSVSNSLSASVSSSLSNSLSSSPSVGDLSDWAFNTSFFIRREDTVTDIQLKLKIGASSNVTSDIVCEGILSNFYDIRFTNANGEILNHWIEDISGTYPDAVATVWFLADELIENVGTKFFVYWGNASAADASNGNNVFVFFDDAQTNKTSSYNVRGYSDPPATGSFTYNATGKYYDLKPLTFGHTVADILLSPGKFGASLHVTFSRSTNLSNQQGGVVATLEGGVTNMLRYYSGIPEKYLQIFVPEKYQISYTFTQYSWYKLELEKNGDQVYFNVRTESGSTVWSSTLTSSNPNDVAIWSLFAAATIGATTSFKNIFICKYPNVVPTISFSSQSDSPSSSLSDSPSTSESSSLSASLSSSLSASVSSSLSASASSSPSVGDLSDWAYNTSFFIRREDTVTDIQLKLKIGASSNVTSDIVCEGILPNFYDIRFTNANGEILNHWIENISGTYPDAVATVWFLADELIENADNKFFVYWGNASAADASNGNNVFVFFDDTQSNRTSSYNTRGVFSPAGTGTLTWDSINKRYLLTNSGAGHLCSMLPALPEGSSVAYFQVRMRRITGTSNQQGGLVKFYPNGSTYVMLRYILAGSYRVIQFGGGESSYIYPQDTWLNVSLSITGNDITARLFDLSDNNIWSRTYVSPTDPGETNWNLFSAYDVGSQNAYTNIFLCKYPDMVPTISYGSQSDSPSTSLSDSPSTSASSSLSDSPSTSLSNSPSTSASSSLSDSPSTSLSNSPSTSASSSLSNSPSTSLSNSPSTSASSSLSNSPSTSLSGSLSNSPSTSLSNSPSSSISKSPSSSPSKSISSSKSSSTSSSPSAGPEERYYPGTVVYAFITVNKASVSETANHFIHQIDASALMLNADFKAQITSRANLLIFDIATQSILPSKILVDTAANTLFIYFDGPKSTAENRIYTICVSPEFNESDSIAAFTGDGISNFWAFDEISGTTAYDSVGTLHQTVTAPIVVGGSDAKISKSLDCSSTTDGGIAQCSGQPLMGVTKFTHTFWYKTSTTGKSQVLMTNSNSTNEIVYQAKLNSNNNLYIYVGSNSNYLFISSFYLPVNQWHNVTVTYDGTASGDNDAKVKCYADNRLVPHGWVGVVPTSIPSISNGFIAHGGTPYNTSTNSLVTGYLDSSALIVGEVKSAGWAADIYNSVQNKATFYSVSPVHIVASASSSLSNSFSSSISSSKSSSPSTSLSHSPSSSPSPSSSLSNSPSSSPSPSSSISSSKSSSPSTSLSHSRSSSPSPSSSLSNSRSSSPSTSPSYGTPTHITVGAGGDFPTYKELSEYLHNNGMPIDDREEDEFLGYYIIVTQTSDITQTEDVSAEISVNEYLNMVIDGNGYTLNTLYSGFNFNFERLGTTINVEIKDLHVVISNPDIVPGISCVQLSGVDKAVIHNCEFICTVGGTTHTNWGFYVDAGLNGEIQVYANIFMGLYGNVIGSVAIPKTVGKITVENNTFYNCGHGSGYGSDALTLDYDTSSSESNFQNNLFFRNNGIPTNYISGATETYTNCAATDDIWTAMGIHAVNCLSGIVDADFMSLVFETENFLKPKPTSLLFNSGVQPAIATVSNDGLLYEDPYPIGEVVGEEERVIYCPIGSNYYSWPPFAGHIISHSYSAKVYNKNIIVEPYGAFSNQKVTAFRFPENFNYVGTIVKAYFSNVYLDNTGWVSNYQTVVGIKLGSFGFWFGDTWWEGGSCLLWVNYADGGNHISPHTLPRGPHNLTMTLQVLSRQGGAEYTIYAQAEFTGGSLTGRIYAGTRRGNIAHYNAGNLEVFADSSVWGSGTCTLDSLLLYSPNLAGKPCIGTIFANFSSSKTEALIGESVQFTDESTSLNPITSWEWDFGEGEGSGVQDPTNAWTSEGYKTVTLSVLSVDGVDTAQETDFIVSMDYNLIAQKDNKNVNLTWNEAPLATSYTLERDTDELFSNPIEFTSNTNSYVDDTLSVLGTYYYRVRSNLAVSWSNVAELDFDYYLIIDFSGTPLEGFSALSVAFTDESEGSILSRLWHFGDGNTSTEQNPVHIYNEPGIYHVTLTINDTEFLSKPYYVLVSTPIADFTTNVTSGEADLVVFFTDISEGNITAWLWDFGDGTTSTEQHPTHTYTVAGSYPVTLTITSGVDIVSEPKSITVLLKADFSATPLSGTIPLLVSFVDNSKGEPTSWLWDFGDGNRSTEQNPTHTYTLIGVRTVKLTVYRGIYQGIMVKEEYIRLISIEPGLGFVRESGPSLVFD